MPLDNPPEQLAAEAPRRENFAKVALVVDLGLARRNNLALEGSKRHVDLEQLEQNKRVHEVGSYEWEEHQKAPLEISAWKSLAAEADSEDEDSEGDMGHGQSHRLAPIEGRASSGAKGSKHHGWRHSSDAANEAQTAREDRNRFNDFWHAADTGFGVLPQPSSKPFKQALAVPMSKNAMKVNLPQPQSLANSSKPIPRKRLTRTQKRNKRRVASKRRAAAPLTMGFKSDEQASSPQATAAVRDNKPQPQPSLKRSVPVSKQPSSGPKRSLWNRSSPTPASRRRPILNYNLKLAGEEEFLAASEACFEGMAENPRHLETNHPGPLRPACASSPDASPSHTGSELVSSMDSTGSPVHSRRRRRRGGKRAGKTPKGTLTGDRLDLEKAPEDAGPGSDSSEQESGTEITRVPVPVKSITDPDGPLFGWTRSLGCLCGGITDSFFPVLVRRRQAGKASDDKGEQPMIKTVSSKLPGSESGVTDLQHHERTTPAESKPTLARGDHVGTDLRGEEDEAYDFFRRAQPGGWPAFARVEDHPHLQLPPAVSIPLEESIHAPKEIQEKSRASTSAAPPVGVRPPPRFVFDWISALPTFTPMPVGYTQPGLPPRFVPGWISARPTFTPMPVGYTQPGPPPRFVLDRMSVLPTFPPMPVDYTQPGPPPRLVLDRMSVLPTFTPMPVDYTQPGQPYASQAYESHRDEDPFLDEDTSQAGPIILSTMHHRQPQSTMSGPLACVDSNGVRQITTTSNAASRQQLPENNTFQQPPRKEGRIGENVNPSAAQNSNIRQSLRESDPIKRISKGGLSSSRWAH